MTTTPDLTPTPEQQRVVCPDCDGTALEVADGDAHGWVECTDCRSACYAPGWAAAL